MIGIRAVALSGTSQSKANVHGMWLQSYDPDAFDGRGDALFTRNVHKAMKFATMEDALACYRQVSTKRPRREDGKPNRPLTAFTVSFEPISPSTKREPR